MKKIQSFLPHLLVLIGFVLVSLTYFSPVLEGKVIFQSDIVQYTGMAKEQNDYRKEYKEEPYWTNSAFGGMPTYQLGANYPHNYVKKLDSILRFLPRPADYLFLYFLGFYILLMVLKIDPLKAFIGSLAFGFSTYLIIILGVGHNAKAHAIAYMPMVLGGVLMVFQRRYVFGGILTAIAAALEIQANHFQMTYYLLLLLVVVSVFYSIYFIKEREYKDLMKSFVVLLSSGILAVGINATNLMATSQYASFSTRSNSELTYNEDGTPKQTSNAMSYEYITQYSYGKAESMNLIAPRLFGGSNNEDLGSDSEMYEFLIGQGVPDYQAVELVKRMPTYWGDQPIVAAPAYIGIVVFFFFILALFIPQNRKLKITLLLGAIFSLLLSWGKNAAFITDLFIEYFPLYNKFRAVSSIQVILELCIPALAVLGLSQFFKLENDKLKWNYLIKSFVTALSILIFIWLLKGTFDFRGMYDAEYEKGYGLEFIKALELDRMNMYSSDVFRSIGYLLIVFVLLFLYVKKIIKPLLATVLIGFVLTFDLFIIAKNYVNKEDFVNEREMKEPFQPNDADLQILKDTTHFRVFEMEGQLNSARASYFHQSIGGYHAAKPRRMQQLFDYQISNNNIQVLNMLNVKYIINSDEKGQPIALMNQGANGNAWFVEKIEEVDSADKEMKALDHLDTKNKAIVNVGILKSKGKTKVNVFSKDSLASISLKKYKPNELVYNSKNSNDGFAVFSEMYYADGWTATVDGNETPIYRVNYALRGIEIPAGNHLIEFKFKPKVVQTGSKIALWSSLVLFLLIIIGVYFETKKAVKL